MSNILAAVFMIGGPILAVVFAVGVFAVIGLVAYDVMSSRRSEPMLSKAALGGREREHAVTRMYLERGFARAFVILGASFWGICMVTVLFLYQRGMEGMFFVVAIPFLMNIACLIVGWNWERTASLMLAATSAGAIWWGVAHTFELGVWVLFVLLLIGPMLTAAVLFWLARQGEIDLAVNLAPAPELAPVRVDQ